MTSSKSFDFPNPRGPLSNRIASAAIDSANREVLAIVVLKLIKNCRKVPALGKKGRSCRFIRHMSELNCSTTEAVKQFSSELATPLARALSTAHRFKQLYLKERRAKRLREAEDLTVSIDSRRRIALKYVP